jgi:hypothetical protein
VKESLGLISDTTIYLPRRTEENDLSSLGPYLNPRTPGVGKPVTCDVVSPQNNVHICFRQATE